MDPTEHHLPKMTIAEVLIVVVALSGLAWVVVPQFTQAAYDGRTGMLSIELQAMRAQVERYRADHDGRYPRASDFVSQMTRPTRADGTSYEGDSNGFWVGPYLREIPMNPYTRGCRVSGRMNDGADWYYDETTGQVFPLGIDYRVGQ
jgi:competence protein ComGC